MDRRSRAPTAPLQPHERAGSRLEQATAARADNDLSEQGHGVSKRRRGSDNARRGVVGAGWCGRRWSGWASAGILANSTVTGSPSHYRTSHEIAGGHMWRPHSAILLLLVTVAARACPLAAAAAGHGHGRATPYTHRMHARTSEMTTS